MVVKLLTHARLVFALTFVASFAVLPLALNPGAASAAPHPTPNGLNGACNMVNDAALPHMREAMELHTAEQGDAGMWHAVDVSGCL